MPLGPTIPGDWSEGYDASYDPAIEVSGRLEGWTQGDLEMFQIQCSVLQQNFLSNSASSLADDEQTPYYVPLMEAAFELLHLRPKDYDWCFSVCVRWCVVTRVFETKVLEEWRQHEGLLVHLGEIECLNDKYGKYHAMPARDLLPLMAVLQLCKVEMDGDSLYDVTRRLIKCRVLELAQASVKHFSKYEDKIVRTNNVLPHWEQPEIYEEVEAYEFW